MGAMLNAGDLMCGAPAHGPQWLEKSGANEKALHSKQTYQQYVAAVQIEIQEEETEYNSALMKSIRQIQLDVEEKRTEPASFTIESVREFVMAGYVDNDKRSAAVTRVLQAYSYRNLRPGYAQGACCSSCDFHGTYSLHARPRNELPRPALFGDSRWR